MKAPAHATLSPKGERVRLLTTTTNAVILSEAKDLGSCLVLALPRPTAEILRFAQNDSKGEGPCYFVPRPTSRWR